MNATDTPTLELSPDKRALFETLLTDEGIDLSSRRRIPPRNTADAIPLSFAQERLWFLNQWEPRNPFYNLPGAVRLTGRLDVAALAQSLHELVRRHEVLRTTFATVEDRPVQVIAPTWEVPLPVVALQALPAETQTAQWQQRIAEEAQRPFNLAQGPLMRVHLLRLSEQEHILLLSLHHIVCDGWSLGVLIRELAMFYEAFTGGRPSPLPELLLQYADFAVWQRTSLQGEALEAQLNYWKKQLAGAPPVLELPLDRPRPPVQSFRGAQQPLVLSRPLTAALKQLSQQAGVTLFMTLLAAFKVLLSRYTGQDEIVVGSPIANRTRAELEGLIGCFVNVLVLRTDLSGNPTFRALLARVREVTLGAYAHQDLPFEQLVKALQPPRDMSRSPLFQIMFVLQNAPRATLELPGLSLELLERHSGTAKFDLTLSLSEQPEGLKGYLEYNTDLFEPAMMSRLAGHFQILLEGLVGNPEQGIRTVPFLSAAERQQLLIDRNDRKAVYRNDQCLHTLVEAQVERTPDAVAVVFEDQQLTYRELNARANQLAHYLSKHGVTPEVVVGLCLERSVEMVVGLLGILKAGGAYLPIDPTYPKERRAFILENAQVPMLLTHQPLLNEALAGQTAQVVCLDTDWTSIGQESTDNPTSGVTPDHLAYVMYTSGSTGRPKGVMITHRGICNTILWMQEAFQLSNTDRILQKTSFSFDVSVWEFFWPLSAGASIVVARPGGHRDSAYLVRTIIEKRITTLHCVPSMLRMFLDEPGLEACQSLRRVFCGGEALSVELQERFFSRLASHLYNGYGPTEACIAPAFWLCQRGTQERSVPIGRPNANMQIYLLDAHLQPVPIGVPGELYIGGVGLARGYLYQPSLTAERFLPDPFCAEPGARFYKTGDLARYRPDGNIEFLGRSDFQVKLRGFRIELGEIEALLVEHPAVSQAVVLAREDAPGEKRLVAYVVLGQEPPPSVTELRHYLKEKLPDYMVPASVVMMKALPLTPNGKLDRKALPPPTRTDREREQAFVAPRSPVEELLATIWVAVLGLERVGIHDNFFELGGHSLLATQVISRMRQVFEIELPIRELFEAPTIAGLAERIETSQALRGPVVPPIQPVSRHADLPLSFVQERFWFLDQLDPGSPVYNVPAVVRLRGPLNVEALKEGFNHLVRRHEILRTTFPSRDGRPIQVIAPELSLPLPILELRDLPEPERAARVHRLALEEGQQPFDLAHGPLLRASLLRLDEQNCLLLLTMHHIISDGWSRAVLTRELAALYEAFTGGRPSPLPELLLQYADFAVWQRASLQGAALDAQLHYWETQLAGASPVLELPTDRPRPAVQSFRGAQQPLVLSRPLTEALKQLSQQEGVTLFMTLLAAFTVLLARYTEQEDLVLGSPIANRTRHELEGLIGCFINTLALRLDVSGNPTFRALLARVREVTLGAYAHQDLPFEQLVEALQPTRDVSRSPLFQVMFVLQNAPRALLELPGLSLELLELDSGTAKFDLTLSLLEQPEGLHGLLEYNTDLFEPETIARMSQHFQTLLEGLVADAEQRIRELPLLTAAEREQLLVTWNATQTADPKDQCVHQLFEAQAEKTPEAIAVVFEDQQLTYRELNAKANQLAHHLQRLGAGPEVCVGLCVERSLDMVIGALGILKAGGAYLPLDPTYPQERLAFLLGDARVSVLLTQKTVAATWPVQNARVVCLDTDSRLVAQESEENPLGSATPDHAAYVIYTSGSTGTPKGVLITHRSLVTAYRAYEGAYQLRTVCTSHLQIAPCSFDVFSGDLVRALCSGAKLVLCPQERLLDPQKLYQLMQEEQVDYVEVVPGVLRLLMQYLETTQQDLSFIRVLVVGADKWYWKDYDQLQRLCDAGTRLINSYGVTEATIDSTSFEYTDVNVSVEPHPARARWRLHARPDGGDIPPTRMLLLHHAAHGRPAPAIASGGPGRPWPNGGVDGIVPIGRPIANTQVYVLDRHLQPVPIGVPGELYIGGLGLARGYVHRPALTATRFLPNPFSGIPGARMYRTGDLVRYRPDGNLEFLDRLDSQVKLRGFRIELGEIEHILRQHPAVREAVVLLREDQPGDKRLVAYVIPNQEQAPATSALRQLLKQTLPDYMLPAAYVPLAALPLTPSGKVDRRALPAPDRTRTELSKTYIAPRNTLELQLVQIWEDLLLVRPIGVTDNFFELGGHSLLAVRLIAKIEQQWEQTLSIAAFFQHATIEQQVAMLHHQSSSTTPSALVPLQPHGSKPPMFLVHPIGGTVFCYVGLARLLGPDQPVYGIQDRGLYAQRDPEDRVEDLAAHYLATLRRLQPQGPYYLGGWSFGGLVAFEMAQQLQRENQQVVLLALLDSYPSLDQNASAAVDEADVLTWFLGDLEGRTGVALTVRLEELRRLKRDEQLDYVLQQARNANLLPLDTDLQHIRRLFHIYQANLRAMARYEPQRYAGRLTVFQTSERPEGRNDPSASWIPLSCEPITVHPVPGNHYTMFATPNVQTLVDGLRRCLEVSPTAEPLLV